MRAYSESASAEASLQTPARENRCSPQPLPEGVHAGSKVVEVPLGDVDTRDNRFQLRVVSRANDLKKSIRATGQQVPVELWGEKPPYKIIDGFRRIAALGAMGSPTVKAIVRDDLSERDALQLAFVENVRRKSFSPMDRANALWVVARKLGGSTDRAALELGLSKKQAARYLRLLQLPKRIQTAVDDGDISMAHAAILSRHRVSDLPSLIREVKENKLSAEILAKRLRGKGRTGGRPKTFGQISDDGVRFYPVRVSCDAPEVERAMLINFLEQALVVLKKSMAAVQS